MASSGPARPRNARSRRGAVRSSGGGPRAPVLWEVSAKVTPPAHWSQEILDRWPVILRRTVCRPTGRGARRLLQIAEITGTDADLAAAARYLRSAPGLDAVSILPLTSGRMYLRIEGPLPPPCRAVFENGAVCSTCLLTTARAEEPGGGWELTWPGSPEELGRFLAELAPSGAPETSILRLRPYRPESGLSGRQAVAVETAFRLGYYAFPRRAHLGTVATSLQVSRSTAAELLRRAEGKLLAVPLGPRAS